MNKILLNELEVLESFCLREDGVEVSVNDIKEKLKNGKTVKVTISKKSKKQRTVVGDPSKRKI